MARQALADRSLPEGLVFEDSRLAWPRRAPDPDGVERVNKLETLRDQVCAHHGAFLKLLQGLLHLDPQLRLSAMKALHCTFFEEVPVE